MPTGAAQQQPRVTIPIQVGDRVYRCRLFRDLSTEEHHEYLAVQVSLCCPDMPHHVLNRLAFTQLLQIARLATERAEVPVAGGEAILIDTPKPEPEREQD